MARAGRKRVATARRRQTTRTGRAPIDRGTPELTDRRAALVGAGNARDQRSSYALGILNLNGWISDAQMDAGWLFAVLRWRLYGKPFPTARDYREYLSRGPGEALDVGVEDEGALRVRYDQAESALRGAGALAWRETRNTAVENRLPPWFQRHKSGSNRSSDARCQQALVAGLDTLARVFRGGSRRAAE